MEKLRNYRRCVFTGALSILFLFVFLIPRIVYSKTEAVRPICAIQGNGERSPYWGDTVTTRGVVFLDLDDASPSGFYIQNEDCDGDPNTSDGIFIYLGERVNVVNRGDKVEVKGKVEEYFGMTEILVSPENVNVISSDNPLPAAKMLDPPPDLEESREYFETLEAMHVGIEEAITVGPTDGSNWSWVVAAALGIDHVFWDDPEGIGKVVCIREGGTFEVDPQVKSGDHILNIRGAVDYELGIYCLRLSEEARVVQVISAQEHDSIKDEQKSAVQDPNGVEPIDTHGFRAATFNLYNLFDTEDDPLTDDTVLSAAEYQRRLQKRAKALADPLLEPDFVGLQEVENGAVLDALTARPELNAAYGYVWQDTPDRRGLDVALLYRTDRVQILEYHTHQGCTKLIDGLGPDGNGNVDEPQNAKTCDTNANGTPDGNRLFSRPPLVVKAQVCLPDCTHPQTQPTVWLITNHFKSKVEDNLTAEFTLPRRIAQAEFVAQLVEEIRADNTEDSILILGDLNDRPGSQPINILSQAGLHITINDLPRHERYTYIFHGISQEMDYVLADLHSPFFLSKVIPYHINADFPIVFNGVSGSIYRSSDHDPIAVRVGFLNQRTYIPLSVRTK